MKIQKSARDIKVGEVILSSNGDRFGKVTMRDGHTTPGVVYLYLDGREDSPANIIMNHGDLVRVQSAPLLEDVIKLARQLKEEWDWDWEAFRAAPEAYAARSGFIIAGDERTTTAAAIRLLMDVE